MAAVSQRVSNYLGGVSKQSDDKKLPGQVRECLNGLPDPTFGLTKRPGFKWIKNLGTGTTYDSARWFYIARTDSERYIGCITPASIAVTGNGTSGATNKTNVEASVSGDSGGIRIKVDLTAASGVVTAMSINNVYHPGDGTADISYGFAHGDTLTVTTSAAGTGAAVTGTLSLGSVYVWNAIDGTSCTVTHSGDARQYLTGLRKNLEILTIQDSSIITNDLVIASRAPNPTYTAKTAATLVMRNAVIPGEDNFKLKIAGVEFEKITALNDGSNYTTILEDLKNKILTSANGGGVKTFTIASGGTDTDRTAGTYKNVAATGGAGTNVLFDVTIDSGGAATLVLSDGGQGYNYAATNSLSIASELIGADAGDTALGITVNTVDSAVAALSNITVTKFPLSLFIDRGSTAFTIEIVEAGADNAKMEIFQDQVDNVAQLPVQAKHGHIMKVINTASDYDTYFATFVADNGTMGRGYWGETRDPAKSTGLIDATMPHELVNTELNTFIFRQVSYAKRLTGDDNTNSHPSFVGNKITQAFFYNNRLGFLSNDHVILSRSGSFYNFYHASAQTVADSDTIDLSCATIRPARLHAVIPTNQGLVLFSNNQQFLMQGQDGVLTPSKSAIAPISNYEMDIDIDPVDVGTNINFVSKTPSYTRVFGMVTRGQSENPQIVDIGRIVNEWIPDDVDTLIGSPQNQFIVLSGQSDRNVYFYRTYGDGEQNLIQSWYKWELPGTVQGVAVDSDDMYAVTKQGSQVTLSHASLSQSPEDAIIVSNEGDKINPCVDLYATATSVVWDSTNRFSKCYIPWNNVTGLTPVLVIKGTTATGQFIDSGFTITPTIATDGSGTYFKVDSKDLTSVASDVIVGWKYNFDITLPKTYLKLDGERGAQSDYIADLTIARMNFSVGLSGVMSFKLKSTGTRQGKKEYVGDGSTTIFNWIEDDLSYTDKNQIKVKINGIESTAFTVSGDTQITLDSASSESKTLSGNGSLKYFDLTYTPINLTNVRVKIGGVLQDSSTYDIVKNYINFNTAPASGTNNISVYSADDITIYLDEWYSFQSTQKADTYLANDIALSNQSVVTIPLHQKSDNFTLRLFNDSPFPVSLNSMMWEGNYSPRFYRRT